MRIISLVPSLTELLFDLGLEKQTVGRTRFCIHPADKVTNTAIVGGTKNPNIEKIKALKPDLVVMNKEENRKEDADEITQLSEVLVTDINTIDEALLAISEIGLITNTKNKAQQIVDTIQNLRKQKPDSTPLRAAYMIWKKPWMTIGGDTYINNVMKEWNLINVFSNQQRYPEISISDIKKQQTDIVLLSSEPYPFSQKHISEITKELPGIDVILINGEWFSWYGSRMIPAFRSLNEWRNSL